MKISSEDHGRAMDYAAQAVQCTNAGLTDLADQFKQAASKIMSGDSEQSFLNWAGERNLNLDRVHGGDPHFASKHTQELFDCWLAARGEKVWVPK